MKTNNLMDTRILLRVLLSAFFILSCAVASGGPIIERLRATFITGEDDMRGGDSWAQLYLWFHGAGEYVHVLNRGEQMESHSAHTETDTLDTPFDLATLSNVGVYFRLPHSIIGATTFLFDAPDSWHMDGFILTGITAAGEEYEIYHNTRINHRFVRNNLYLDDSWRVDWWQSPVLDLTGSESSVYDEMHLNLRTAGDDLRPGSRAFCEVALTNGWRFEERLFTRPVRLADHTGFRHVFRLPRRVAPSEIASVSLRFEGQNSGGSTDEWRLLGWSLTAARGRSTAEVLSGATERLRRVIVEEFSGVHFQRSRKETVVFQTTPPVPTDGQMQVTVETGGDDLREGSKVYLRLLLTDGGLFESVLNAGSPSWGDNSSTVLERDLPDWLQLRNISDFAIRYESGRISGSGDDQWRLRRFFINYNSSLVSPPGLAHDSGDVDHHFHESSTYRSTMGVSIEPLQEAPQNLVYTFRGRLIPLLASAPFAGDDPFSYQDWLGLLQQNQSRWASVLQLPPDDRFGQYVFGLLPGERPVVELEMLPPTPESFGREVRLRYAHILSLADVQFTIYHSSDLVYWEEVPFSWQKDWAIVPDLMGRKEWREVTLWGPAAGDGKHFYRVSPVPMNQ